MGQAVTEGQEGRGKCDLTRGLSGWNISKRMNKKETKLVSPGKGKNSVLR